MGKRGNTLSFWMRVLLFCYCCQEIAARPQFLQETFLNPFTKAVGQGEKVAEDVIDDVACITLGLGKKCNPPKKEVDEEVIIPSRASQDEYSGFIKTTTTTAPTTTTATGSTTTTESPSSTTTSTESSIDTSPTTTTTTTTPVPPSSSTLAEVTTMTPSSVASSSSGDSTSENIISSTSSSSLEATSTPSEGRSQKSVADGDASNKDSQKEDGDFTDFQKLGLDLHNKIRSNHASQELVLNNTMNEMAQTWAEAVLKRGKLGASPAKGRSYAENVFKISGGDDKITDKEAMGSAVKAWYESQRWFNHAKPKPTGFSQIVWNDTTQLGIGLASNDDTAIVVATYYPRGNIVVVGSEADTLAKFKKNVSPLITNPEEVFS